MEEGMDRWMACALECRNLLAFDGFGPFEDWSVLACIALSAYISVPAQQHDEASEQAYNPILLPLTSHTPIKNQISHSSSPHLSFSLFPHNPRNPLTHIFTYSPIYRCELPLHTFFTKPSRCASRFRLSSPSPMARTKPQSAYTWFSPVYRPLSSTLPTEICTEAWSLALMMRLVAEHLRGT